MDIKFPNRRFLIRFDSSLSMPPRSLKRQLSPVSEPAREETKAGDI
jgi:hypothetical protein